MNRSLDDFVHDALLRGVSRADIARALETGGWSPKEIQAALDAFVETALPVPVPRKGVSNSPKEAFFHLLRFSMLYTAAFSLGSVLFDLINLALPQPGETGLWNLSSLRWGIAAVIVAFPLFLFMSWLVAREAAVNPGQRISPIRRWLTYLTLFIAAVAIVSDLVTLIVTFLEGDVTVRFTLKVAVVAALAGGAFVYYLRDLRRDELRPSAGAPRARRSAKLALAGLVLFVLAALTPAAYLAGSPRRARLIAQDNQRVADLQQIYWHVRSYYTDQGKLPESLAAADTNPETFVDQKADRITNSPYVYRVDNPTHFVVGATFALPSTEDRRDQRYGSYIGPENEGFWKHGPGPQLFRIDVARKKP